MKIKFSKKTASLENKTMCKYFLLPLYIHNFYNDRNKRLNNT